MVISKYLMTDHWWIMRVQGCNFMSQPVDVCCLRVSHTFEALVIQVERERKVLVFLIIRFLPPLSCSLSIQAAFFYSLLPLSDPSSQFSVVVSFLVSYSCHSYSTFHEMMFINIIRCCLFPLSSSGSLFCCLTRELREVERRIGRERKFLKAEGKEERERETHQQNRKWIPPS